MGMKAGGERQERKTREKERFFSALPWPLRSSLDSNILSLLHGCGARTKGGREGEAIGQEEDATHAGCTRGIKVTHTRISSAAAATKAILLLTGFQNFLIFLLNHGNAFERRLCNLLYTCGKYVRGKKKPYSSRSWQSFRYGVL